MHKPSPAGNLYDKYHTKNPIFRAVVNRFLLTLKSVILSLDKIESILDVGCGDGFILDYIAKEEQFSRLEGIDISEEIIEKAKKNYPRLKFFTSSACHMGYKDREFDLVIACEVLEHITDYRKALLEISRVSARYSIISVPLEPIFRITNMARGAYITSLGNTPGHVNHWNKKSFMELINEYFFVEKVLYPTPWQIALCRKRI